MGSGKLAELPVLDLSRMALGPIERNHFLAELRQTAHGIGFFYLTGHGVDPVLVHDILATSRRFFNLPIQDKLAIEMLHSPHFRGYTRVGMERTRGLPDWREQIDIGAELPARPMDTGLESWWWLQGPNQWPAALPELKSLVLRYQAAVTDVAIRLVRAFLAALDQDEHTFDAIFNPHPQQLIKLIRYPGRESTEGDQGVGAHKDGGFVTMLLQDVQNGLQVDYEGEWISAPPIPGTFIINIGELLEMASDGYLRATVHRAVTPPPGTDRLAVGFFFGACLDASIPVLSLKSELAAEMRGVTVDPLNPMFHDTGKNQMKSRLRSHPDVAQRHHAALLS